MSIMDTTGYAAALCTSSAYVPQVLKVWRTRETHDMSLKTFSVLVAGIILWLTYGYLSSDIPLMAANSATLLCASTILFFKIKHG